MSLPLFIRISSSFNQSKFSQSGTYLFASIACSRLNGSERSAKYPCLRGGLTVSTQCITTKKIPWLFQSRQRTQGFIARYDSYLLAPENV